MDQSNTNGQVLVEKVDKPSNDQIELVQGKKLTSPYPEEGVQLIKTIGTNVNPNGVNKHVNKGIYEKKDGNSSSTTVQSVKISHANKNGIYDSILFIKAVKDDAKLGDNP